MEVNFGGQKLHLRHLAFLFVVFLASFSSPVYSAELFETYQIWSRPKFFVFGEFSKDLKTFKIWNSANTMTAIPVTKLRACPDTLENTKGVFEVSRVGGRTGEAIQGDQSSWAIELEANSPSVQLTFSGKGNLSSCALRIEIKPRWIDSDSGIEPRIVFSDAKHSIAGREIFIEENVFIAGLQFKVEALSGIKFIRIADENFFAPIINASFRATAPRVWNGYAEFRMGQSLKSFPKEISFSRWEAKTGFSYLTNYMDGLTLSPFVGIERNFILTEQSLSLPDGAENVLGIGLGLEGSLEFLDVWALNGSAFVSLLTGSSSEAEKWRYFIFEGAVAYRFTPLLRVAGVSSFRILKSQKSGSLWGGELGLKVEMDF